MLSVSKLLKLVDDQSMHIKVSLDEDLIFTKKMMHT